jgi:hypothetical protein
MSYVPTGAEGTGASSKSKRDAFSRTDDSSEGSISGYVTLSGTQGVAVQSQPLHMPSVSSKKRGSAPARRDEIRRSLVKAKEAAGNLETYAKGGDGMELSLEGFRLRQLLSDLWSLRSEREDDWGDLLNLLQAALAQEEFERFTQEQCHAVHTIVADHLGSGAVGEDDIERAIAVLRGAGFDPWKGISGSL